MSSVCQYLLSQDIAYDCNDPVTSGLEPNGIIMNREDVDFGAAVFSETLPNVLEQIKLKAGKKGYAIVQGGKTPFTGTNTSMAEGTYRNSFTNVVQMIVLDNGAEVTNNIIDGLANGEFVIVLENKYKGLNKETNAGSAAFQVYGWYNGLKASEISNDKYSEDTDGGWLITLQEEKSPRSGMFLYKTSYAVSKAAYDALKETASASSNG